MSNFLATVLPFQPFTTPGLPQTDILQDKSEHVLLLIKQEATRSTCVVFIATLSPPQKHCFLKSKFTLQLVQWFSIYIEKNTVMCLIT